ncbi:Peroxisome chaperone and import receptor [Exophiala dermatitidis]|uniref:Peroxin-19 n=2 Tax=Exophiala dermatitidis TaxID=5970 RepID=H6BU75_EXODN|nr:uncharacterized protein HMPREF1120_03782 [Exophiala dermatitidis NIH/UT8656]KAJ4506610.1 Peroxisome chaperone and import receptor [Exophiala dermatitidis]EHY55652.1 hypothetical protein HMPREF1120_03782 [Exophiala dermatitidis NIH/UT8656]KAJ4508885.1 Peroxisome chaperone and import receptor [Exophiala dermatitidis]KAJ4510137.1 Peroxisome chaperone and import receptor [Exophiala dermatitidis]KAJ4539141.1 Peroxisome chaperone and import receptor [Exophiala dermatitidis]
MAEHSEPPSTQGHEETPPPTGTAQDTDRASQKQPGVTAEDADSDPDFDDLDDVLDQFSAATAAQSSKPQSLSQPSPSSSGPGRPAAAATTVGSSSTETALPPDIPIPTGPHANETEEEFMARLTAEMSSVMSKMSQDPAASAATPEDIAKMGKELEEFTYKMEAEGVKPEDLLKAILGEDTGARVGELAEAERERERRESESKSKQKPAPTTSSSTTKAGAPTIANAEGPSSKSQPASKPSSFEDTIRRTMARMESSSAAAASATAQASAPKSEEDMLAELLRALESEGGGAGGEGGDAGDLSKMFLGMMEQLTNKDMLYEPMKELSAKYPEWLAQNRATLPKAEFERFSRQRVIVDEIVAKFEESSYSDASAQCREFVWEKMQAMQGEGAPPEDLIANPLPGMGIPGLGSGEDAEKVLEEGCPTQ